MNGIVFIAIINLSYLLETVTVDALSPVPPCQKEMNEYLASQQNEFPLLGAREPVCDSDGFYAPKQCSGSQCYCVTKLGRNIRGYTANRWESSQQTCQCARDQAEYRATGMRGKMFMCTSDGSYKNIQCVGSVCYCSDSYGNRIGTSTAPIGQHDSLNC